LTMTTGTLLVGDAHSSGTLNLLGGASTITASALTVGRGSGASGSLTIAAGGITVLTRTTVGAADATGGVPTTATVGQSGGILTTSNVNHVLSLAPDPNSSAAYNISAGILFPRTLLVGDAGSATYTQSNPGLF